MKFDDVIDPVIRCVNYRFSVILFQDEINEEGKLHMHCAISWLYKAEILKHSFARMGSGIFRRNPDNARWERSTLLIFNFVS